MPDHIHIPVSHACQVHKELAKEIDKLYRMKGVGKTHIVNPEYVACMIAEQLPYCDCGVMAPKKD